MRKIRVSYPFVLLTAIFIIFDNNNRLILTISAMLIHEAGHIFGLIYKGIPFEKVTIGMTGANIIYGSNKLTSYKDDIFIAAMGSCFNFLAICILVAAENIALCDLSFFIGINMMLGVFNMLPVIPLDGGRIIQSILSMRLEPILAEIIMRKLGTAAAVVGICVGIKLIWTQGNYTLLLVSSVIFINNLLEV